MRIRVIFYRLFHPSIAASFPFESCSAEQSKRESEREIASESKSVGASEREGCERNFTARRWKIECGDESQQLTARQPMCESHPCTWRWRPRESGYSMCARAAINAPDAVMSPVSQYNNAVS